MEELCENAVVHNIQITYHMPNEILKHRINYKYMAIETDKHVKIMFDKLERIPEVTNIELYIQLEPCAEVRIEEIQQTTTSLQVTVLDAQYKYSTHVEDNDVHADGDDDDNDDDDDYVDETTAINNDDDDDDNDYIDETTTINGEDFVDKDEYEKRIERGDFERDIDDDETLVGSEPDADNVINVENIMDTIPTYAPPALSFSANIWKNIVDPSHIEMPFVSTWREGMNLCKWLTFANKVEVKRVLTICALKGKKTFYDQQVDEEKTLCEMHE